VDNILCHLLQCCRKLEKSQLKNESAAISALIVYRLQRFRYGFMCPIHGRLGHVAVLILMTALLYGALWSITGEEALPGGNLFALSVLFVCCYVAGFLIGLIRLPPLLGKRAA